MNLCVRTRVGTLGWYAMPSQGKGLETRWTGPVLEPRSRHGIGNTVDEPGVGTAVTAWTQDRKRGGCLVSIQGEGIVQETRSRPDPGNVIVQFALVGKIMVEKGVNLPCRALIRLRRLAALKGPRIQAQSIALMQPLLASGAGRGHSGRCLTPILLRSISASFVN